MKKPETTAQASESVQERAQRFAKIIGAMVLSVRARFSLCSVGASMTGSPDLKPVECMNPDAWHY